MLFEANGWVSTPRLGKRVDGYIFAYGHDYREAVRVLYTISGNQPLIPRWALGNWWSQFHRYTAAEYLTLMDRFHAEGIPLSVAAVDMHWHLVYHPRVVGSGWTGYSWDTDLFPSPPIFWLSCIAKVSK